MKIENKTGRMMGYSSLLAVGLNLEKAQYVIDAYQIYLISFIIFMILGMPFAST
jgi:hypothetical protein